MKNINLFIIISYVFYHIFNLRSVKFYIIAFYSIFICLVEYLYNKNLYSLIKVIY